ncbi:ankyrin repeat-containing protein [Anaeramoeba flamelloides]|uniref:Ankyrin repeat-containing protein n=1 Tax=Anaeramoeba flamelloides TaxID=1746091 RepID=A0AAV7YK78_9EUKA|nr:ankyrin repeat-containing protein [Anaeramoeba flamelloides]
MEIFELIDHVEIPPNNIPEISINLRLGMNPFFYACFKNKIQWILRLRAWFQEWSLGEIAVTSSPLHYCMNANCNIHVVEYLVDQLGFSVNSPNEKMQTPLHLCCKSVPSTKILEYLLTHGGDPNMLDKEKNNCLLYLLQNETLTEERLKLLLSKEIKFGAFNIYEYCIENGVELKFLKVLSEYGAKIQEQRSQTDDLTFKHLGSTESIDPQGSLILQAIARGASEEKLKWLIKQGASVYVNCFNGTILHHSVFYKKEFRIIKTLIENSKLDLNCLNYHSETPLMIAIKSRAPKNLIEDLINYGADVNLKNWQGNNSLHLAILHQSPIPIIMLLLFKGANPKEKNENGQTPIDLQGSQFLKTNSSIIFDFLSLVGKHSRTNLTIKSKDQKKFDLHQEIILIRLPTDLDTIKEALSNVVSKELQLFIQWVYSGIVETNKQKKLIRKILYSLGVAQKINLKQGFLTFMTDIRRLYQNEESKDFQILVPVMKNHDSNCLDSKKENQNVKDNENVDENENEKEKEKVNEIEKVNENEIEKVNNLNLKKDNKIMKDSTNIKGDNTEKNQEIIDSNDDNFDDEYDEIDLDSCEKIAVKIHSSVLQARSNLFRGMLLSCSEDFSNKVTDYSRSSVQAIKALVHYLYTNEIERGLPNRVLRELRSLEEFYQLNLSSNLVVLVNEILHRRKQKRTLKKQKQTDQLQIKTVKTNNTKLRNRSRSRGRGKNRNNFKSKKTKRGGRRLNKNKNKKNKNKNKNKKK